MPNNVLVQVLTKVEINGDRSERSTLSFGKKLYLIKKDSLKTPIKLDTELDRFEINQVVE